MKITLIYDDSSLQLSFFSYVFKLGIWETKYKTNRVLIIVFLNYLELYVFKQK